ncbi:uncharacterized protein LOC110861001 [Folsomia candida]|uniref:Ubiquitin carboxyl-terminal hydrolase 17 n=1 Tax=Folsomia candida TaxID=158441 RepID=A0A226D3L2_FOLCA|nr:uncharacterized protein LOC110861001 [Folsomia candida]OXA39809.1 Ubiquitin carboxyl-terminal hydrolase 17 [Folsomia candida]
MGDVNAIDTSELNREVGTVLKTPYHLTETDRHLPPEFAKICFDLKVQKYTVILVKFHEVIANYEACIIQAATKTGGIGFVYKGKYENLLEGLQDRPKDLKMDVVEGYDELATFCQAVMVGWRLWPDYWVGLQKIVDYLANDVLVEDVKRMERPFVLILKEIALHEMWPTDPVLGAGIASQAKKIVFRYKSTSPEVTTLLHVKTMLTVWSAGVTPKGDHVGKRICDGVGCLEVEGKTVTFPHCVKCKVEVYHSKRCQKKAWQAGHKKECNPPG